MVNRCFIDKLVEKLRFLEPSEIGYYLRLLAKEKGFLETVFNSILEGLIVTDPHDRILYINHAAGTFFGINETKSIGDPIENIIHGLGLNSIAKSGETMSRDLEVFYPARRLLNFYVTPLLTNQKKLIQQEVIGRVIILRDITQEQRKTEEAIESECFSAVTLLAAGVAHEIGNPLNSLDIQLQVLARKLKQSSFPESAVLTESVAIAREEVKRLDNIINQFLYAIRPAPLLVVATDFNALILESISFLKNEAENRNIHIHIIPQPNIPLISLDPQQIRQALYNVIRNSFQAIGNDGQIRIATGYDLNHAWVTICDTGGGIQPTYVQKIFEPYVTTKEKGTGLGLYLVQRIVRAHMGEIIMQSAEGKGLILTIKLPRTDRRVAFLPAKTDNSQL